MTVPYFEPDICPRCGVDLLEQPVYRPDGVPQWSEASGTSRVIGIEIQGVYDGVLFWCCPDCKGTWNRWDPVRDPRRWQAAEKHRALFTGIDRGVRS